MTTEQQPAEPFEGTVHFLGVRASFAKAKELLRAVLDEKIDSELHDEIEAFLAQFEADA